MDGEPGQSGHEFRMLLDAAQEAIIVFKPDSTILTANRAASQMIGYGNPEELVGRMGSQLFQYRKDWNTIILELLRMGHAKNMALTILKRDGNPIQVFAAITLCHDKEGQPLRAIGFFSDTVDYKPLEKRIWHSQKMEAIGTMAGGIAHNFNNILGVILGNTQLAIELLHAGTSNLELLEEIYTASLRAKNITKQLLVYSRQTDDKLEVIDIVPIVNETMKLVNVIVPPTIRLIKSISCEKEPVLANAFQINQIIMNLATNAIQAITEMGGWIEIKLEKITIQKKSTMLEWDLLPGHYVLLTVTDNGHGIKEELIPRIFDPYFTTREMDQGTGMGLSVVHGIVNNLGGVINLRSIPDQETTFEVYLPVSEEPIQSEDSCTQNIDLKGNERILIIDDEGPIGKVGKETLDFFGYHVDMKTDGLAALEQFRQQPDNYDLLVIDHLMPNISGEMLSREILSIRPDLPIIIWTGKAEILDPERVLKMGVKSILFKPVDMYELGIAVRKALN